jgi:hypothetical protein
MRALSSGRLRAAFSRISNALRGIEPTSDAELQERLGCYYRNYQNTRTWIAQGMKLTGLSLARDAIFQEWRRLDTDFLRELRQLSGPTRYDRLRHLIQEVGWGETVTRDIESATEQTAPVSSARGHLTVSDPYCLSDLYGNERWRVSILNDGSIVVANVQMKLMGVTPQPRSPLWNRDLPRFVGRAGMTLDTPSDRINVNDASVYELIIAQPGSPRSVIAFDNQSQQIQMENEERWCLSYRLTSENTDPISVTFRLYFEGHKIMMERHADVVAAEGFGLS